MVYSAKARVSIGLPVYNGESFLTESLDSLVTQTFADFELIISDNASTDRTEEICRTYAARDQRIRFFRNDVNIGVYKNFNRVFLISSGEYFKWACADDISDCNLVARCLELIENQPSIVAVYPRTRFINEKGDLLSVQDPGWNLQTDTAPERMRAVINGGHWVNLFYGLIRRSALARTRLFPSYNSGDYRLLGELCLQGKFIETPEYLLSRRIHRFAASQNSDRVWQARFHSGHSPRPGLPFWHLCSDHFVTIFRSQLSFTQKCSLIGTLLHRMFLAKRRLAEELVAASHEVIQRLFHLPIHTEPPH